MSTGGLVTIVFTDLVGSTARARKLGGAAAEVLSQRVLDRL